MSNRQSGQNNRTDMPQTDQQLLDTEQVPDTEQQENDKSKKVKRRGGLLSVIAIILVLLLGVGGATMLFSGSSNNEANALQQQAELIKQDVIKEVTNQLSDSGLGETMGFDSEQLESFASGISDDLIQQAIEQCLNMHDKLSAEDVENMENKLREELKEYCNEQIAEYERTHGSDGSDGSDGSNGSGNGSNGNDGSNGNGSNGKDGANGSDGLSAEAIDRISDTVYERILDQVTESILASLETKISDLVQDYLKETNSNIELVKSYAESHIQQIEKDIETLNTEFKNIENDIEHLKTLSNSMVTKQDFNVMQEKVNTLAQQIENYNKEMSTLINSLSADMLAKYDELKAAIAANRTQIDINTADIASLRTSVDASITDLRQQLETSISDINQTLVDNSSTFNDLLTIEIDNVNNRIDEITNKTNSDLQASLDQTKQELQNQINNTNQNLNDTKNDINNSISDTKNEISNSISDTKNDLQQNITNNSEHHTDVENKLDQSIENKYEQTNNYINDTSNSLYEMIDNTADLLTQNIQNLKNEQTSIWTTTTDTTIKNMTDIKDKTNQNLNTLTDITNQNMTNLMARYDQFALTLQSELSTLESSMQLALNSLIAYEDKAFSTIEEVTTHNNQNIADTFTKMTGYTNALQTYTDLAATGLYNRLADTNLRLTGTSTAYMGFVTKQPSSSAGHPVWRIGQNHTDFADIYYTQGADYASNVGGSGKYDPNKAAANRIEFSTLADVAAAKNTLATDSAAANSAVQANLDNLWTIVSDGTTDGWNHTTKKDRPASGSTITGNKYQTGLVNVGSDTIKIGESGKLADIASQNRNETTGKYEGNATFTENGSVTSGGWQLTNPIYSKYESQDYTTTNNKFDTSVDTTKYHTTSTREETESTEEASSNESSSD